MVTLTDITAMRLWARDGLLESLGMPVRREDWSVAGARELWDAGVDQLGIPCSKEDPIHVLVDAPEHRIQSDRVVSHVWSGRLPAGSLYQLAPGLLIASPAFCCLLAAARQSTPRVLALEMECLGMYGRAPIPRGFLDRDPLVETEELANFFSDAKGCPGSKKALEALKWACERSRSPLETKTVIVLVLPRRLGGYGLPLPDLNCRVWAHAEELQISQFPVHEVDLCWPEKRTIVECDSYAYHVSPAQLNHDAMKRNSLKAMGWKVSSVTDGQLSGDALDVLARQLGIDLGIKVRLPDPQRRDWLLGQIL